METPMISREGRYVHVVTAEGALRLDWHRLLMVTAFVMNTGQSDELVQQRLAAADPHFPDLDGYMQAARQVVDHGIDLSEVA